MPAVTIQGPPITTVASATEAPFLSRPMAKKVGARVVLTINLKLNESALSLYPYDTKRSSRNRTNH